MTWSSPIFKVGDRVWVARARDDQQCIYPDHRVGTIHDVLANGWYDVLLHDMCRTWYQHDQLEPLAPMPRDPRVAYLLPDAPTQGEPVTELLSSPENRISDSTLTYLPLTSADSPKHNNLELRLDGELVPRMREIEMSDTQVRLVTVPCAFALRYKTLMADNATAALEYHNRKFRWRCVAARVTYHAERMRWPGAVCELVTHFELCGPWTQEAL